MERRNGAFSSRRLRSDARVDWQLTERHSSTIASRQVAVEYAYREIRRLCDENDAEMIILVLPDAIDDVPTDQLDTLSAQVVDVREPLAKQLPEPSAQAWDTRYSFGATGNWWITIQTRKCMPGSRKYCRRQYAERDRILDALARPGRMVTENVTPEQPNRRSRSLMLMNGASRAGAGRDGLPAGSWDLLRSRCTNSRTSEGSAGVVPLLEISALLTAGQERPLRLLLLRRSRTNHPAAKPRASSAAIHTAKIITPYVDI